MARVRTRLQLERDYQAKLVKRIERMIPGCYVRKHEMQQGWPDLIILAPGFWAMLETKREEPTCEDDFEPNQEWWIEEFDSMSFAACIYPANEKEILHALLEASRARR